MASSTSWLLLALGVSSALATANALRPHRRTLLLVPSFFAAWLTVELAVHHLIAQAVAAGMLIAGGGLEGWPGAVGLALLLASWAGLLWIHRVAWRADVLVGEALRSAEIEAGVAPARFPRLHLFAPPLTWLRRDVDRVRGVVYADDHGRPLRLDIFRPRGPVTPGARRPAILQVHGGAWVLGFKEWQGVPLLTHLAANGWVGFNIDYRLSPRATFPEHLIDVKRAIAWIRAHAEELGVDPEFIAVTGGSAGGHLTALAALTAGDPEYQPGFESADTSVQAAVAFYGVYDLANVLGNKPRRYLRLLERLLIKRRYEEDQAAYLKASPLERIHEDAPPMFVIHGSLDNLAPVGDARAFVERLRAATGELVVYAELPGASHAFDIFPSVRTVAVIEAVERFLDRLHRQHRAGVLRARRPRVEAAE